MRRSLLILAAAIFGTSAFAQTTISFECYPAGPLPLDPTGSCEGAASNGLGGFGGQTGVMSFGDCAFPTAGTKYARLDANGPVSVAGGGPFPWPVPVSNPPAEIRVPIPAGSTGISFDWQYFNAEGGSSFFFNDGMAVAVLNSAGTLVQQLVYADNQMPYGGCFEFFNFAQEILPAGVHNFAGALPGLAGCEYLSIICWNDGDNAVSSVAFVDNITFNSLGPSCPVPCFGGPPGLVFSSPSGPGCIQVNISGMPGNGTYFIAITLFGGAFPNGWFYGIDIGFADLISEVNFGFPFWGPTNPCGTVQIGEFCGVPPGVPLFAVVLGMNGPVLGPWSVVSPSASYVIP